ncbi:hypothetical protein M2138_001440 [Dysgonomonadaceae bacterium PH5-43]|nr:hypothetical protein [Dysgonomonadaceae bacterium PH5-43]
MSNRLKIICVLFAAVYVFIVGDTIFSLFASNHGGYETQIDTFGIKENLSLKAAEDGKPLFLLKTITSVVFMCIAYLATFFISCIYVPIQYYKLLRSIHNNVIFDFNNVKTIKKIGNATIINFLITVIILLPLIRYIFHYGGIDINSTTFGVFRTAEYLDILLMGLLTLLFGEILRIALSMKEEQDLTI